MVSDKPTIYKRLCDIQVDLLECNLKKSGWNGFKKYSYYELEDLLPSILRLCKKYECSIYFIFSDDEGILKFYTNDGAESISTRVTMPELQPINKGSNLIQSEGAYQTYAKRYMLMNLFCISEIDEIDMNGSTENNTTERKSNKSETKSQRSTNSEPAGWDKLIDYLKNKYPTAKSFGKDSYNSGRFQLFKKGLITKKENEALYEYIEKMTE